MSLRPNTFHAVGRSWQGYLFLLPALAIYALFVLTPIADSFRMSLYHWSSAGADPQYVGLANFARLGGDTVFWLALWHNVLLVVVSLLVQLPAAMLLAVLLSYPIRGRAFFRTVFFAPMVMPSVAIAVLWSYVYLPEQGILDSAIRLFNSGFGGDWLGSPTSAMLCVFITICWLYTGFYTVLFMAGIASIPEELYDAARIDGASEWQCFRHVTLPMLRPMIAVAATLSVVGSLKYFDLVYMMAQGAPETSRELMATYMYRLAFDSGQGRFGYAAAVAVALFIIAFAIAGTVTWWNRRTER